MSSLENVTVGIKSFHRPEKVRACLESISNSDFEFNSVMVMDDGEIDQRKQELYDEYSEVLDLEVFDLDYDLGVGPARNKMAEELETKYLLMMDDDMQVASNVDLLHSALEEYDRLGGVAGSLVEERGPRALAHDIFYDGNILVRDVRGELEELDFGERYTAKVFDFIPNAVMLRKDCLEDGRWDDEFVIGKAHLDFFVNHNRNTDWEFALIEQVGFEHNPGGSDTFTDNRYNREKLENSNEYFKEKWGIEGIAWISSYLVNNDDLEKKAKDLVKKVLSARIVALIQEENWAREDKSYLRLLKKIFYES